MSDFLTDLALRSVGLAETIRPRLPSLFEPPHMDSGWVTRPGLFPSTRDEDLLQQDASGSVMEAPTDHQYAMRQPPVVDLVPPEIDKPETIKARLGHQTRRATVASPTQSLGHFHSLSSRRPLDAQHIPVSRPESSFISQSPAEGSLPRFGKVQVDTVRSTIIPPTDSEREAADGIKGLRSDQRPLPTETKPHFSASQTTTSQTSPTSQTVLPTSSISHLASKATRTIEPSLSPGRPATGFAAVPRSNPSEPVIRVTIGRVDVRAVFSDPPVRHAQPRQSKRTITLDEYLKRSSRG